MNDLDRADPDPDFPGESDEARAYVALSRIGVREQPLSTTLQQVASLAKRTLPEHPEASVTLVKADHPETVGFTSDLAVQLDERQYARGFGPCLDAAVSGATISLTMADADSAYPDSRRLAQRVGVTHSLSLGLPVATGFAGALNLYSSSGEPFSSRASRIAATFASIAGLLLGRASDYHNAVALAEQLQQALSSRAVIEQAKGILMEHHRCSSEEAFKILTQLSQHQNVKLRTVAQRLVEATAASRRERPS
jgi:hypothetical protein